MIQDKKIAIIGLGLIGGSIALAIKKGHPNNRLIGIDTNQEAVESGKKLHVIDEIVPDIKEVSAEIDIIFICTPTVQTKKILQELQQIKFKSNVIVTDVGSTKVEIVNMAHQNQSQKVVFVGGHPMAGSHKSGVFAAAADLFENAYYLFTPENEQEEQAYDFLCDLLIATNAKFLKIKPREHDQIVGILSHIPHIVAAGLVNQTNSFLQEHPSARNLAAGGFRDITRIASSDPVMWTDILLTNQQILLHDLAQWQLEIAEIQHFIAEGNRKAIHQFFTKAKETRDSLPVHSKGAIPSFYDLFIDIPDYPGAIAEVTARLAEAKLSIINLKILETREEIQGILQVTFKNKKDLVQGKACITKHTTYPCYEK